MDMREINAGVIAEFRKNDGVLSGPMEGAPILLLTTVGRRSGKPHTTPVGYIDANGHLAAAAANGGSDNHPDWFLNLQHDASVLVELPGVTIASVAEVAEEPLRDELLNVFAASLPGMSDHLEASAREVPVVIFREAD